MEDALLVRRETGVLHSGILARYFDVAPLLPEHLKLSFSLDFFWKEINSMSRYTNHQSKAGEKLHLVVSR